MTAPSWLPDLEEELLPHPPTLDLASATHRVTAPGKAEIKKHNDDGIRDGLRQLGARIGPAAGRRTISAGQPRYLITYRPVTVTRPGAPTVLAVDVYAIGFPAGTPVADSVAAVMRMRWLKLGRVLVPALPPGPASQYDARLGRAVESRVRSLFIDKIVRPRQGALRGWAHDVVWDELADFYRELAAELSPSGGSLRF
jgi:hypothetical protein